MQCKHVHLLHLRGLRLIPTPPPLPSRSRDRFDALTTRINELQPPSETSSDGSKSPGTSPGSSSAKDDERGLAEAPGGGDGDDKQTGATEIVAGSDRGVGRSGADVASEGSVGTAVGGGDENALSGRQGGHSRKGEGGEKESEDGASGESETEEERLRREELEVLEDKRMGVMVEMLTCSQFHHVFEDSNADDGLVPDMSGDDEEGGEGDAAPGGASASESGGAVKVEEGEAK